MPTNRSPLYLERSIWVMCRISTLNIPDGSDPFGEMKFTSITWPTAIILMKPEFSLMRMPAPAVDTSVTLNW